MAQFIVYFKNAVHGIFEERKILVGPQKIPTKIALQGLRYTSVLEAVIHDCLEQ